MKLREYYMQVRVIKGKYLALVTSLASQVKDAMAADFDAMIFDRYPVNKVGFVAYTPYFNDGDECRFTVYGVGCSDNIQLDSDTGYVYDNYSYNQNNKKWERYEFSVMAEDIVESIPLTLLETVFGNHVFVQYNKNKEWSITPYDHD